MGFYGNITNTVKTNLQFDRKYSNRYQMETHCASDGVYAGRYVLVEYDLAWDKADTAIVQPDGTVTRDTIVMMYQVSGQRGFSSAYNTFIPVDPVVGRLYRVVTLKDWVTSIDQILTQYYTDIYYIAEANDVTGEVELRRAASTDSTYVLNFNIDNTYYGEGRGWDSTVWMKSYDSEGKPLYVNVAELNSVVPTFNITVDAPTEIPQAPHFDQNNTNIFYTIHLQPQWGFQIANTDQYNSVIAPKYPDIDKIPTNENAKALYFNLEGMNPETKALKEGINDSVAFTPTWASGYLYNDKEHQVGSPPTAQVDTMEFSMILPSLGNAVSEMWDVVYEPNNNNELRKLDIAWKDAFNQDPDNSKGGMSLNPETLAGTINIAHKLMGMIVANTPNNELLNETEYNYHYIYKDGNNYKRIARYPNMIVNVNEIDPLTNYYVSIGDNNYKKVNPHTVSEDTVLFIQNGYLYDWVDLPEFGKSLSTINGCIIRMAELLGISDPDSVDTTTVQGSINVLNSIIKVFGDLIPAQFVIVDNNGNVVSSDWTTKQALSYHRGFSTAETNIDNKENQWIQLSLDGVNRIISVTHTLADRNIEPQTKITNFNAVAGDNFNLYTPVVDNAGHVISNDTETIILPYNLKTLNTNGNNSSIADLTAAAGSIIATTPVDTFNINTANKWIKTANNNSTKTLQIGHLVNPVAVESDALEGNLNSPAEISTLNIRDYEFDNAGHISKIQNHNYTLPYTYNHLTANNSNETNDLKNEGSAPGATTAAADSVFDTLTIKGANKWIQTKLDNTDDSLSIAHEVHTISTNNIEDDATTGRLTDSFNLQTITYDNAGHLTSTTSTKKYLPFFYSSAEILGTTDKVVARKTSDSLMFSSDQWVKLEAASNNTITLKHNLAVEDSLQKIIGDNATDLTLGFGGTFHVPYIVFDEKGHLFKEKSLDRDITIPSISVNESAQGNVVVGAGISAADKGQIVLTKKNIGNLLLTDYTVGTQDTAVTSSDSINSAFGKLQYKINNLTNTVKLTNYTLGGSKEAISANDSINTAFGKLQLNINTLNGSVTTEGSVQKQISDAIGNLVGTGENAVNVKSLDSNVKILIGSDTGTSSRAIAKNVLNTTVITIGEGENAISGTIIDVLNNLLSKINASA